MDTTTTTADPATRALAVATDTRLAEVVEASAKHAAATERAISTVRHLLGHRARHVSRTRKEWPTTADEAIRELQDKLAAGEVASWDVHVAQTALADVDTHRAARAAAADEADALEQTWRDNGRWSRFFLVQNSNGHVHSDVSSVRCSRTETTTHGWYPHLSGLTEADAVAELGPRLCTTCFPSAPVEWTVGKPKPARCPGTKKQPAPGTTKRIGMNLYGDCGTCSTRQIVTLSGIRAHPPATD